MSDSFEILRGVGLGYPYQRMIFGAVLASAVAYSMQAPKASFNEDGSMRPWKVTSGQEDATWLPFFLIPLAGSTFGVFV